MSRKQLPEQLPTLALLIDADNISIDLLPQIMKQVEAWGRITIRRVYGNQEALLSQKWKDGCLRYALQPVAHVGISGAKNATDIALTVDAMDVLHKENILTFCLVTGDQDFTALILRLRSQGCVVYCIGRPSKADALAKVCTVFIPVEQLSASVIATPKQNKIPQKKTQGTQMKADALPPDLALTVLLTQATKKIMEEKQLKWISLPRLGSCLKQINPQFQAKTHGYKSLPELIKACTDLFEIRSQGNHLEVRLKS